MCPSELRGNVMRGGIWARIACFRRGSGTSFIVWVVIVFFYNKEVQTEHARRKGNVGRAENKRKISRVVAKR